LRRSLAFPLGYTLLRVHLLAIGIVMWRWRPNVASCTWAARSGARLRAPGGQGVAEPRLALL
jgi:hypothetical protein